MGESVNTFRLGKKMAGKSKRTKVVSLRLPNELMAKIEKRVKSGEWDSVGHYLRERITYDILRQHRRWRPIPTPIPKQK